MRFINITEYEDGSADYEIEYTKTEKEMIKAELGLKRLTKKALRDFTLKILTDYAEKKLEKK